MAEGDCVMRLFSSARSYITPPMPLNGTIKGKIFYSKIFVKFRILPSANEVWGKVIFFCVSFCSQGAGLHPGVCIQEGLHPWGGLHLGNVCIQGCLHPEGLLQWWGEGADPAPIGYYRIRSTRGLYAFYWNAFLLSLSLMNSEESSNNPKHQKEACCEIQQIRLVDWKDDNVHYKSWSASVIFFFRLEMVL